MRKMSPEFFEDAISSLVAALFLTFESNGRFFHTPHTVGINKLKMRNFAQRVDSTSRNSNLGEFYHSSQSC
jgi:hypothetical protein